MKKTYIEPETLLLDFVSDVTFMNESITLTVFNGTPQASEPDDDNEIDDFDKLLSNHSKLWDE